LSRSTRIDSRHGADRSGGADSATERCFPVLTEYPDGVIYDVSPRDHMYNSYDPPDLEGYLSHGKTALDCIRISLLAAQKERPRSILDLPSGHGRVLRFLKAEYPEARLAACDIDREAVDFCARTFGAAPVYGREHPAEIELAAQFDLIWCGSLFTHLDEALWNEFLDFFESSLVPGGVVVFTTSGRNMAARLRDDSEGATILKDADSRCAILQQYTESGFGHAGYDLPDDMREDLSLPVGFGIAVSQPSWVCSRLERRPGLQLVAYTENRWGAQDVVTCLRVDHIERAYPFRTPLESS
jgi:SAM-dependent methyltransferase